MHRLQNRVVMSQEALDAYRRKQHENTTLAESATFVCDLQAACAMLGALSLGKQFHVQMEQRNLLADAAVVTGLVSNVCQMRAACLLLSNCLIHCLTEMSRRGVA